MRTHVKYVSNDESRTVVRYALAQGAAGTTQIAAAAPGLKHKVIGMIFTMSADGTAKLTDGSGDLTGAFDISGKGGMVSLLSPHLPIVITAANSALSIVTTGGAAKGVILYTTEA